MKKWIRPRTEIQQFEANEYVAVCGDIVGPGKRYEGVQFSSASIYEVEVGYLDSSTNSFVCYNGEKQWITRGAWYGTLPDGTEVNDATGGGYILNCTAEVGYSERHQLPSDQATVYSCLNLNQNSTNYENFHYHLNNVSGHS